MDQVAAALGDPARWRMVELLAAHPRSVGELAQLTGLRQPQATKHLQSLARVGLVAVHPLGQRRVYALEAPALAAFERRLHDLVEATTAHAGDLDVIARYQAAIGEETARVDRQGWADGRSFVFERLLAAPRVAVWQHWVDPELLAGWWAPPSLVVTRCALVPRRGGRALLEYRDSDGRTYLSDGHVLAATKRAHLAFDLTVRDADGAAMLTGRYDVRLGESPGGTRLEVQMTIAASTVQAVPAIAGIEQGWEQTLDQLATAVTTVRRTGSTRPQRPETTTPDAPRPETSAPDPTGDQP